jgi:uncharacterized membrane protein
VPAEHWQLAFMGNWPWLPVLSAAGLAAALAALLYRAQRSSLPGRWLRTLSGFRAAAVVVVAVFLLQPVVRLTTTRRQSTTVAVLLDVSESMGLTDTASGRSRLAEAVWALTEGGMLDRLRAAHRVRAFAFGAVTEEIAEGMDLAGLEPEHSATATAEAFRSVAGSLGSERLAGVVLLTDGVTTRGPPPPEAAAELGVPVCPVAVGGDVGERGRFFDVGIVHTPVAPRLAVDNTASLTASVAHRGLLAFSPEQRTLRVRLLDGDGEAVATTVRLPAADGTTEVSLDYVPAEVGLRELQVVVDSLPGEPVTENNAGSFTAQVSDPVIRVLIVEGVARSEYRFLRRTLEADPNLEVTAVVKVSPRRFLVQGVQPGIDLGGGLPARAEDMDRFHVVVLGDVGRDEFTPQRLDELRSFVDRGGALLALGGYHAFGAGGHADGPLADVLPLTMEGRHDGHVDEPFVPVLTPEGREHLVFNGCSEFLATGQAVLQGANRVTGAKPGADVLAEHPREAVGGRPMPVVAVHRYGAGRALAVTADTTWQWKLGGAAGPPAQAYDRFWRQSLRWLAGRTAPAAPVRPVRAWAARTECDPADPVEIEARVADAGGRPVADAAVEVEISYPTPVESGGNWSEHTTVRLEPSAAAPGAYALRWPAPAGGLYRATARATVGGQSLGEDRFEFAVGRFPSEFDDVGVDEEALRAVAARTGGVLRTPATAADVADVLPRDLSTVVHRMELSLWNAPWCFVLFLAFITTEWVLRKRMGLD